MNEQIPYHACVETSPSGAYRSTFNQTPIGERCEHCGVLMEKKYAIWPKATVSTESTQADKEV